LVRKVIVHKRLERDGTQLADRLHPVLEDLPELVGRRLQRGVSQLRALGAILDVIDEGVLFGLGQVADLVAERLQLGAYLLRQADGLPDLLADQRLGLAGDRRDRGRREDAADDRARDDAVLARLLGRGDGHLALAGRPAAATSASAAARWSAAPSRAAHAGERFLSIAVLLFDEPVLPALVYAWRCACRRLCLSLRASIWRACLISSLTCWSCGIALSSLKNARHRVTGAYGLGGSISLSILNPLVERQLRRQAAAAHLLHRLRGRPSMR
jgi:hypothetical protein